MLHKVCLLLQRGYCLCVAHIQDGFQYAWCEMVMMELPDILSLSLFQSSSSIHKTWTGICHPEIKELQPNMDAQTQTHTDMHLLNLICEERCLVEPDLSSCPFSFILTPAFFIFPHLKSHVGASSIPSQLSN